MAAPFDRCTAYFGAPFLTHALGCGQTIVVRLAGTLEAGPGMIPLTATPTCCSTKRPRACWCVRRNGPGLMPGR
jgi:hypothetical protein